MLNELLMPIKIGAKTVKNRMALPPMILGEATPDGYVTPEMIRRYRTVAEGGAGLIIVEGVAVNTPGAKGIGGLIARNNNTQDFNKIADEIHLRGAVGVMQVLHCGRQALPEANNGAQPVSVSDIPYWMGDRFSPTPKAATLEDLEDIKREFANAALLAQQAGFDGIEVHCAHGYILATFLSPKANNRTDRYGGSWEARMAYPLEVVRAVRAAVRPDFIVGARISANYAVEGEPAVDDMLVFAKELEKSGCDYVSVSGGTYESHWKQSPPCYLPRNSNIEESAIIKQALNVPVLVAGGICYPEEANDIVKSGKADIVCLGRALFADPALPNKIKLGKLDEIRPCIRCNLEFADTFQQHKARCSVNFTMGREGDYELYPAAARKKVMVVGGGPGGMEAARVAALRGHTVDLYEAGPALGGRLAMASAPAHKEEIGRLLDYFVRQMALCGVNVHTGTRVDAALVQREKPDALIMATGAEPSVPPIPGLETAEVLMGEDVLMDKAPVGERVLIVGAGCVGIDLVLKLTGQGKRVSVVEMADQCGTDLDVISRSAVKKLFDGLEKTGQLTLHTGTMLKEIRPNAVVLEKDGKTTEAPYDDLVLALGYTPASVTPDELRGLVADCWTVGDVAGARRIRHAIHEGFVAGYSI